mgnify:CR=1 FL=1
MGWKKEEKSLSTFFLFFSIAQIFSGNVKTKLILSLQQQLKDMTHDIEVKESAATQMAQIALKEANQIIQNANDNADAIIKEAYYCARDILESISRLGVEAQGIKDSMNEQLVQLIESIERFDVPPIPSAELLKKCDE